MFLCKYCDKKYKLKTSHENHETKCPEKPVTKKNSNNTSNTAQTTATNNSLNNVFESTSNNLLTNTTDNAPNSISNNIENAMRHEIDELKQENTTLKIAHQRDKDANIMYLTSLTNAQRFMNKMADIAMTSTQTLNTIFQTHNFVPRIQYYTEY